MDPKTEKKRMKELKKMSKKTLKQTGQNLMAEHEEVLKRYKDVAKAYNAMTATLLTAIDADDSTTTELARSKVGVLKDELDRLMKREKTLAEEIELVSKSLKNDFDGKSGVWTTVGAWVIGAATTGLSAWGLIKSHKAFEDGSMVDKGTKGLAEKLNGLFNFSGFFKKG